MRGKNPTRKQADFITSNRLNYKNWLVCKDTSNEMVVKHRISERLRIIRKKVMP